MLHRVKRENDLNHDKWIGLGGKFEPDESPDECLLREIREEAGIELTSWRCRGVVTFVSDEWEGEQMFLFTADAFEGELRDCDEGVLEWVPKADIHRLNLWEGDLIFHRLIDEDEPFFLLKLQYRGDELIFAALNGRRIK